VSKILVVLGSKSDEKYLESLEQVFKDFNVQYDIVISSAHRNPEKTATLAKNAKKNGYKVIIAGAGMAAHLPGVIASMTTLPVIGVPLPGSDLNGLDSLFSIVQMPGGVPVASMGIGKHGMKNAALFAVQILSLSNDILKEKYTTYKKNLAK